MGAGTRRRPAAKYKEGDRVVFNYNGTERTGPILKVDKPTSKVGEFKYLLPLGRGGAGDKASVPESAILRLASEVRRGAGSDRAQAAAAAAAASPNLPEGWVQKVDAYNRPYYFDNHTGQKSWSPPPAPGGAAAAAAPAAAPAQNLPEGWTLAVDRYNKPLYVNSRTGQTSATPPGHGGAAAAPPTPALPEGWALGKDQFGQEVFVNQSTGKAYYSLPDTVAHHHNIVTETKLSTAEGSYMAKDQFGHKIPVNGTLQEIADAHNERVALATKDLDQITAAEDAAVRAAEVDLAAAQTRVAAAVERRKKSLAEHGTILKTCQVEAIEAAQAIDTFRSRVAVDGLDELDVKDVFELLHQLGTPVSLAVLEKQEVSGIVLAGLTESEMEAVFKIRTLGERRRLALALRRLADRRGFDAPETLDWDIERVCAWLVEEGLAILQTVFRNQAVDGEVLLTLTREDLECLGVTTLGGRATLIAKIGQVKKLHYAGQVVDGAGGAAIAGCQMSADQRLVLEQVLEENAALAERIAAARDDAAGDAAAALPDNFLCPITCTVMDDPAVAADGYTYEREAIETWFRRHNTSPMTGLVIAPTLLPNFNLRSHIASWGE